MGFAGFHDSAGSVTSDDAWNILRDELGLTGAIRAAIVFSILERRPEPGELLMDGIAVDADARGQGIGTALFDELEAYAGEHGLDRIHLEVIDTNPDARRLYERLGFVATKTERTPYLRRIMGFSAVTSMVKSLR